MDLLNPNQLNPLQLSNLQVRLLSRAIVEKGAGGSRRLSLENNFAADIRRTMLQWFREISTNLLNSGLLHTAILQAQRLREHGYNKVELNQAANEFAAHSLSPLIHNLAHDKYVETIEHQVRVWDRMLFAFGAVTALRALGFHATSPDLKSKLVTKAADDEPLIFELSDAEIIRALENRALIVGADLTEDMLSAARQIIRDRVFLGHESLYIVANDIANSFGIANWKGLRIARTEAQAAFNTATFKMYQRSGVLRHAWVTVGDDRVRPSHAANEDQGYIPVGEPFQNGSEQPGEGPDSINCRCTLEADLSDPKLLLDPWLGGETDEEDDAEPE